MNSSCDVAIVGAGPNGLTAAAVLALAGLNVIVLERNSSVGGSCRTDRLTSPGFAHDTCAAIHPMAAVSPVFQRLPLEDHGLRWVSARFPMAHPLIDGRAAVLARDLVQTSDGLGSDGEQWRTLLSPFVERHVDFFSGLLRPIRIPAHAALMTRFGRLALQSCDALVTRFRDGPARALLAGNAAHSMLSLHDRGSAAIGLVLAVAAHAADWPVARGGSQQIVDALARLARAHGVEIRIDAPVRTLTDVPPARAILFDVTPRRLLDIAGDTLSPAYRRQLASFRHGPGSFKIDYALSSRIPWQSADCSDAATVHVGGTFEEIARSEADVAAGRIPDAPFVLVAQQSHVDDTRAPAGLHTGWMYCHVPNGCVEDMTERIERQIERFAPGFRETILARHVTTPRALEDRNPNLVGGDIAGGANSLRQIVWRPAFRWNPYATPDPRLFLCSSSTPPGAGVHGMCGYWAAHTVLRRVFGITMPASLEI